MSKIGVFCDNVLQGSTTGVLHAFMLHHYEHKGKWPTLFHCFRVLENKGMEPDEWDTRIAYFRIKEGES